MGIESRFGLVLGNIAMLLPVFIILITSAIMSAIGAANLAKLKDQNESVKNAHKLVTNSTIVLWALFGGGLLFAFTIGLILIPWLITIPYLYGGIMIIFAIINLVLAGILFSGANTARTSKDYKDSNPAAKAAYNNLLICGILMVVSAVFIIGYAVYTIYKYHKMGGVTSDVALASEIGKVVAPEYAVPLAAAGEAAKARLSEAQQQKVQENVAQASQLQALFKKPSSS